MAENVRHVTFRVPAAMPSAYRSSHPCGSLPPAPATATTPDFQCPNCHRGHLQLVEHFPRSRAPPLTSTTDRHPLPITPAAA